MGALLRETLKISATSMAATFVVMAILCATIHMLVKDKEQ